MYCREGICCWSTVILDSNDANVSMCLSGMIGVKSGVHLSLLSLMEELLLPPNHSLSALSLRTKERKAKESPKGAAGGAKEAEERIDASTGYATFRRV